jgi:Tfp pilus assembly protein FimT
MNMEKAFTLLETLITIGIMAVIGIIVFLNLQGAKSSTDVASTAQQMTVLLRQAQSSAAAQKNDTAWSVYFSNATPTPFFALVSSSTYSSSTVMASYPLPSTVGFETSTLTQGSSLTVTFSPISGAVPTSTEIGIYAKNNPTLVANIAISGSGNINYNTCNGLFSSWGGATSLPIALALSPATAYNGYVYALGGSYDNFGDATETVYYARINPNGTIGSWGITTQLPDSGSDNATPAAAYNGYIYFLEWGGGLPGTSSVYYASINTNGTLGAWNSTAAMQTTYFEPAIAYNGYLYSIGGIIDQNSPADATATVNYAQINTNGTLGTWASTAPLPSKIAGQPAIAYNGYLYSIGGTIGGTASNPNASANATSTVNYAQINPNGTLGTWTSTAPLPTSTAFQFAFVYNNYLYSIGGESPTSSAYYAQINTNGTLGTWAPTAPLPTSTYWQPSVNYNGYTYSIGGINNAGVPTSTVYYATLCAAGSF